MHTRPPASRARTRVYCDETGQSGDEPGVRTYEFCPFCGDRIPGDRGHELVFSMPE